MSTHAEVSAPPVAPPIKRRRVLRPALVYLGMLLLSLACLRQWGSPAPWARLDIFSGSYVVINVLFRMRGFFAARAGMGMKSEATREALGLTFDPRSAFWMRLLGLSQPAVMLDYGHLHLVPALENPVLQSIGLGLYLLAEFGLVWVDTFLMRQFYGDLEGRSLVTDGPYRQVRHPRYTFLLTGKIGITLVFASLLGALLTLGWLVLLLRRIPKEEAHLGTIFGEEYDAYVRRSARLLPGLY